MKKLFSVLGDVFVAVILIFAVVLTVAVITSAKSDDRITNLFGYAFLSVQTDSMATETGFNVGDMIFIHLVNEEEADHLKVGDVITFRRVQNNQMYLDTHRIVAFTADKGMEYEEHAPEIVDGVWIHNGKPYYITQGDNEEMADLDPASGGLEYTGSEKIVGIWTGKSVPKLGAAMDFLKSPTGFMVCVVIPIALFFIYQLYVFIMTLTRRQKEKALEEVADKEAELKAKAVAEFLAQQQANGGGTVPPAEGTAPAADAAGNATPVPPTPQDVAAAEPVKADTSDVSEEEKQRIIQEYLAKQQKKDEE